MKHFLENPIETFVDLDFEGITISNIGDDMTSDQKGKSTRSCSAGYSD